jgi:DNA-binding beta-propeller fold protein YncE
MRLPLTRVLAALAVGLAGAAACGPAARAAAPAYSGSVVGEPPQGGGVFRFPQAVAVTPGGGTVFVGDQNSGVVQAFGADGTPKFTVGFQASRGEPGRLGVVGGVATDRSGHLYVLDSENERVQVFDAGDGRFLAQFGDPSYFDLMAGDPATISGGRSASGIAVAQAPGGPPVVYVADQGNERVARFVLSATTLQPVGAPSFSPPSVDLAAPQGVALDPAATRVYVADDDHHRVVVLRADTLEPITSVGTFGSGPGQLQNPYDVAVDNATPNRLYVADNQNHRVDVFDADTLFFLRTFGGYGYGAGTGTMAVVRSVGALTDVPGGGVDVADTANDRIHAFDADGNLRAIWGLSGRGPGYVTRPRGVAFGPDGAVAVADAFDARVALFAPDGTYIGLRGLVSASTGFAAPGAAPGQLDLPDDVAYDPAGNLWVSDAGNDRVQELAPDGRVLVVAAVGAPRGIAADASGAYVAGARDGAVVHVGGDGAVAPIRTGLTAPTAVALGPDGHVYAAGATTVLDATTGAAIAPPPGAAAWDHPAGLALDAAGALVVAERRPGTPAGARVVRRDPADGTWATLATEGPDAEQVVDPGGLDVSPDGQTVLVADTGNDRVLRLDAAGHAPPPRATLTVGVTGIDRGTVVSDLPGIACVSDCRQSYGTGRSVTLTAQPHSGSVVGGWSGACAGAGTAATCTVAMGTDQVAGVTFAPAPPPPAPPAPAPAPPPPAPVVLRSVRLSTHTLHPARRADRRRHRAARKATRARVTVVLTRPATLTARVLAGRPGRRSGSSCVAVTRRNRRARPCTRFVATTRTRTLRPGARTMTFTLTATFGARRALAAGSYRLGVVAVDAGGNRAGPRLASFRVRP